MGLYAGVYSNLTLCRLQSSSTTMGNPMPESTLSSSQGLRIWPQYSECSVPESIEWIIEDQACSPSYNLVPPVFPHPLPPPFSQYAWPAHRETEKQRQLADRRWGGAKSYDCEKARYSLNPSIYTALEEAPRINLITVSYGAKVPAAP